MREAEHVVFGLGPSSRLAEERDAAEARRAQGVAVVGVLEGEKAAAVRLADELPILARHPERGLDGGRAVVRVKDAGERVGGEEADQRGAEFDGEGVREAEESYSGRTGLVAP